MAMSFGLKNASARHQRLVIKLFIGKIVINMKAYVDDMIVKSKTSEKHLLDLKETFNGLRRFGIVLNPKNYAFKVSPNKFKGFMV